MFTDIRKILVIIILLIIISENCLPQSKEYIVKSALVEKFVNYIEWPETNWQKKKQIFNIGIFGESSFGESLKLLLDDVKINGQEFKISEYSDQNELPHLIVVGSVDEEDLKNLIVRVENKPVLLITDLDEYAKLDLHIRIYLSEEDHIRFKFNRKAFETTGLYVSNMLLRYAEITE